MNWLVMNDGDICEFFPDEAKARAFLAAKVKEAEDGADVDGYPKFVSELALWQCRAQVEQRPYEGLEVRDV